MEEVLEEKIDSLSKWLTAKEFDIGQPSEPS